MQEYSRTISQSTPFPHQSSFEVLHSFPAEQVGDVPGEGGRVLPQVEEEKKRLLADPHLLHAVRQAGHDQMHATLSRHLMGLISCVRHRLHHTERERERDGQSERETWGRD